MKGPGTEERSVFSTIKPIVNSTLGSIRPPFVVPRLTANLQDRYEQISKEFDEIDENDDKQLTFEEIYSFLCKKSGGTFDKSLALELFAKMDRNEDTLVTKNEFVWSYVDAEKLIIQRTNELRRQIAENTKQMEETKRKMIEAKQTEVMNEFGIMNGSVLTVNVVEAQNLKAMNNGTSDPYVTLACERQKIETKYVTGDTNPVWNEVFTFQIQHGNDDLKISVLHHNSYGKDDLEGQLSIPLRLLQDQMKHDQFFDLQGPKANQPWQGRIHLGLQWIWSKSRYLEEVISQWQENIDTDKQELDHLTKQLNKLREPFGVLIHPTDLSKIRQDSKAKLEQVENVFSAKLDNFTKDAIGKEIDWSNTVFYVTVIYLLISCLVMFIRPDFPNVIYSQLVIPLVALTFHLTDKNSPSSYRKLALFIALSELYDFIWFIFFTSVRDI